MTVIPKVHIKELYSANLLYELYLVDARILLFQKKYDTSFLEFEKK